MDNNSFNRSVKPLNLKYMAIFDTIPRITDYSCTREEYLDGMRKAIDSKKPLSEFFVRHVSR